MSIIAYAKSTISTATINVQSIILAKSMFILYNILSLPFCYILFPEKLKYFLKMYDAYFRRKFPIYLVRTHTTSSGVVPGKQLNLVVILVPVRYKFVINYFRRVA